MKGESAADLFLGSGPVSASAQDIGPDGKKRYFRVGRPLGGCVPDSLGLVNATGVGVDPRQIQQSRLVTRNQAR